jgi:hypothetical protein
LAMAQASNRNSVEMIACDAQPPAVHPQQGRVRKSSAIHCLSHITFQSTPSFQPTT